MTLLVSVWLFMAKYVRFDESSMTFMHMPCLYSDFAARFSHYLENCRSSQTPTLLCHVYKAKFPSKSRIST